jgi:hypothetical protein
MIMKLIGLLGVWVFLTFVYHTAIASKMCAYLFALLFACLFYLSCSLKFLSFFSNLKFCVFVEGQRLLWCAPTDTGP